MRSEKMSKALVEGEFDADKTSDQFCDLREEIETTKCFWWIFTGDQEIFEEFKFYE